MATAFAPGVSSMFRSVRSSLPGGIGRAFGQSNGRGVVPTAAYHRSIRVVMRDGHSTRGTIEEEMTLDPAAIFVMILGILTGVAAWRSSRGTESSRLISDALTIAKESRTEVKELQDRIDKMEAREKERDTREAELLEGVWILIGQLEDAGITPQWYPKGQRRPGVEQKPKRPTQKRKGF